MLFCKLDDKINTQICNQYIYIYATWQLTILTRKCSWNIVISGSKWCPWIWSLQKIFKNIKLVCTFKHYADHIDVGRCEVANSGRHNMLCNIVFVVVNYCNFWQMRLMCLCHDTTMMDLCSHIVYFFCKISHLVLDQRYC